MSEEFRAPPPYLPPEWDDAIVAAFQAQAAGKATAGQQQAVLDFIITKICGTYDLEYRPDSRDHAFASGRRFPGLQIVKLLKLKQGMISKREVRDSFSAPDIPTDSSNPE